MNVVSFKGGQADKQKAEILRNLRDVQKKLKDNYGDRNLLLMYESNLRAQLRAVGG